MADSDAERQRRRRAHASGDHRLCLPARCNLAGAHPVRHLEASTAAIPAAMFSSAPPTVELPPQGPAPDPAPATSASAAGGATPGERGSSAGVATPGSGAPHDRELSSVADAMRADIAELGELVGIEGSLAAIALKLGEAIDDADDPKLLPGLSREARSTLTELTLSLNPRTPPRGQTPPAAAGGEVTENEPDGWSGMDAPV